MARGQPSTASSQPTKFGDCRQTVWHGERSIQRAGCEARKSGSVRGAAGQPAVPSRPEGTLTASSRGWSRELSVCSWGKSFPTCCVIRERNVSQLCWHGGAGLLAKPNTHADSGPNELGIYPATPQCLVERPPRPAFEDLTRLSRSNPDSFESAAQIVYSRLYLCRRQCI